MPSVLEAILGNKTAQEDVHTGEVFQLWHNLMMRYDIHELTDIFQNFAHDLEFKAMLTLGMNILKNEIAQLEDQMDKIGIPLPPRPPKSINTPANTEVLRDELMFRVVFSGVQNFVGEQTQAVLAMQNKSLRAMFVKMMTGEVDLYTKLSDYGKIKGWLALPPAYKITSK